MLQNNDIFPSLTLARAGGGEVHLPGDLAGGFGVILFYRGAWSEVCVDQLEAFSRAADEFASEGVNVVSVSVDDQEAAEALVEQHKLAFPVAYAADARAVSAVTGIPINDDAVSFEATGFVINPEGRIETAVYSTFEAGEDRIVTAIYSSGAIGRLMPNEVLRLVRKARGSERPRSDGKGLPGAPRADQSETGVGL
jgi:peroxiredoxin